MLNSRDDTLHRDSLKYAAVVLVLLASTVISLYGFSTLEWPSMNSATRTILLSALVLATLTVFTRKSPIVLGAGLVGGLSIACGQAWPMIVVAVLAASSMTLGRWMLGRRIATDWTVQLLIGIGTFGTLTGLAAYFPINYSWLHATLLLLPLVLGHQHAGATAQAFLRWVRAERAPQPPLQTVLDVLIAGFACLYAAVAFMPEVGHDALAMHLFIPAHLAQRHQWSFDAGTYAWAVMPMLADWIYGIGYMLAGETASRLSNCAFTLLVAWQVRNLTIWAGGTATSARWASLFFLSTPLAFAESSSLFIESAWTAFVLGGSLAILKVSRFTSEAPERQSQLILAGTLLGFALATKAITLSILPVLLVLLLMQYKAWVRPGVVRTLLLGSIGLLLAGITPYLSAWHLTGNPVFPFFNGVFQSPLWPSVNFEPPAIFGKGVTWDTLYRMVFKAPQFIEGKAGAAGFQWLLVPTAAVVLALSAQRKAWCILLLGAGAIILPFQSTAYLRYIFPSFALFSVVLALPFSDNKVFPKTLGIIAGASLVLANVLFIQAATYYGQIKPLALFSQAGRDAYLSETLPIRKIVDAVNVLNVGNRPVAVFASPLMAGLKGDALYASWYNVTWKNEFDTATSPPALTRLLHRRQVGWLVIDHNSTPEAQLERLQNVSDAYVKMGALELRKVNQAPQERLLNPDLSGLEGWHLTRPSSYDALRKVLTVTVTTPATQRVEAAPGQAFVSVVSARCATQTTPGRIQTNWMNADGAFISASIETFDCTPQWETYEMNGVAPADAAFAIIYASGHNDTPVEFKSLSFKQ
ncbi:MULTISPECIES: phospholipid carrier-dependent glycosyltransferase [Pseudomonas]|uniref:phospholipid carrier-dependent glycosyltransferase n=1 Tax=Pseudomonas TaxID=286 RepID=UPI001BE77646|nr:MULTISPECIES: phospholipid carrier-dependent glycosyltransferase [Pseudomonas]MBT2338999.1 phospholipid carrier-dependent glycosyltransferase [Pseudomonas fluorescens]MCD4527785.1 phospholipid carrier-dependent glycosyltransferase [Pseudomonas sp. C3-2018]